MTSSPIAAAGGVVWRTADGGLQVAVVHRPRYDDWSLPKGKLGDGEDELAAAVREIAEETGSRVAVQRRLGRIRYDVGVERSHDPRGTDKTVAYWSMRWLSGSFEVTEEVDELRWLGIEQAREQLTYELDRSVLSEFASVPVADSVVALVRHAKAGKRSQWTGEDDLRPLEAAGERQAAALVSVLCCFGATRVMSAEPVRCIATVTPLAACLGVEVEVIAAFSDHSYVQAPIAATTALFSLATPGVVTAVCSQGLTIPSLLAAVAPQLKTTDTRKGEFWVLSFVDGAVVAADHYPAPVR